MGIRRLNSHDFPRFVAFDGHTPPTVGPRDDGAMGGAGGLAWGAWLRLVERKRRMLSRAGPTRRRRLPEVVYARATFASFRLDGLDVDERDVVEALAVDPGRRQLRSRLGQRVRNHAAILHAIEKSLRVNETLKPSAVVRWYTSVSSGLSVAGLDDLSMDRLDGVVRRINAPQLRLQSALREVARLHTSLLADPLVPGFNGILSRLLLHYHLGRSMLPPVLFDPTDSPRLFDETMVLARLMEGVDEMYNAMIEDAAK